MDTLEMVTIGLLALGFICLVVDALWMNYLAKAIEKDLREIERKIKRLNKG